MRVAELRQSARAIFDAAVRAVDPAEAIRRHVVREGARLTIGRDVVDLETSGRSWWWVWARLGRPWPPRWRRSWEIASVAARS